MTASGREKKAKRREKYVRQIPRARTKKPPENEAPSEPVPGVFDWSAALERFDGFLEPEREPKRDTAPPWAKMKLQHRKCAVIRALGGSLEDCRKVTGLSIETVKHLGIKIRGYRELREHVARTAAVSAGMLGLCTRAINSALQDPAADAIGKAELAVKVLKGGGVFRDAVDTSLSGNIGVGSAEQALLEDLRLAEAPPAATAEGA